MSNNKWYVVYTKPRWEKKVSKILLSKQIIHFCPLIKVSRQWSDRVKTIEEPLFKGYVFIQPNETNLWEIKTIDGILNYVHYEKKPATIRQSEIDNIKKFLNEFSDVEVTSKDVFKNDNVKIKQGLMMDYKGLIIQIKGNKAIVEIQSLGFNLMATFDKQNLEKI